MRVSNQPQSNKNITTRKGENFEKAKALPKLINRGNYRPQSGARKIVLKRIDLAGTAEQTREKNRFMQANTGTAGIALTPQKVLRQRARERAGKDAQLGKERGEKSTGKLRKNPTTRFLTVASISSGYIDSTKLR